MPHMGTRSTLLLPLFFKSMRLHIYIRKDRKGGSETRSKFLHRRVIGKVRNIFSNSDRAQLETPVVENDVDTVIRTIQKRTGRIMRAAFEKIDILWS